MHRVCLISKPDHFLVDSLYSSWPLRAQPPLDQARARVGRRDVQLPCSGESGKVNLGQHVVSNCEPEVMRNLPQAKKPVRPSGAWLQGTCTLSLGFLGTSPEELGERT